MKTMRFIIATLLVSTLTLPARAIDLGFAKEDAGQAGAFLDFAASARSLAMGHAHTGVANDAAASYWNAAGLSQLTRKDIVTLYSPLELNTSFGFFSYAQPALDYGTFGLSVVSLQSNGYEKREANSTVKVGEFDTSELAFLLSHGIRVNSMWSVGSSLKFIRQEIDQYSGSGYGLDAGAMMHLHPRFQLGFALDNILAPKVKLQSKSDTYPRELRAGLQYLPGKRWVVAMDLAKSENRSLKPKLGVEWRPNNVLALRTGINETELTAGMGFVIGDWGIDYAFAQNHALAGREDLGNSHRFGFHVSFGRDITEQGQSVRWQNKGREILAAFEGQMDEELPPAKADLDKLTQVAEEVIDRRGYSKAQDLYTIRGYIHYFYGEYERSVQSLGEAAALDPQNSTLATHLEKARQKMSEDGVRKTVSTEMDQLKSRYDAGDLRGAVQSAKKILAVKPDHIEAQAYLEDAERRINEPIERALKIAKAKFERQEYLDAIKSLHNVRKLDPENKEAADYMSRAIAALEQSAMIPMPIETGVPVRQVQEIQRDTQKSRQLYSRGLQLYSQGKLQDAMTAWKDAVRYDSLNSLAKTAYQRALLEVQEKP